MKTRTRKRLQALTVAALRRRFLADGFTPGAPAGLDAAALAIDQSIARQARCPGCGRRGMTSEPFHDDGGRYRVLLICSRCERAEEF